MRTSGSRARPLSSSGISTSVETVILAGASAEPVILVPQASSTGLQIPTQPTAVPSPLPSPIATPYTQHAYFAVSVSGLEPNTTYAVENAATELSGCGGMSKTFVTAGYFVTQ